MRNDDNKIENGMIEWRGESDVMEDYERMVKKGNWQTMKDFFEEKRTNLNSK